VPSALLRAGLVAGAGLAVIVLVIMFHDDGPIAGSPDLQRLYQQRLTSRWAETGDRRSPTGLNFPSTVRGPRPRPV
jgi:hypothetical protein